MKFNEFKPKLTEEQIVLAYCKGEITKEDAVSRLREAPQDPRVDQLTKQNIAKGKSTSQGGTGDFFDRMAAGFRRMGNKVTGGFVDSPEEQARQDAEAEVATQVAIQNRRNRGGQGRRSPTRTRNNAATPPAPGLSISPNAANAARPPAPVPAVPPQGKTPAQTGGAQGEFGGTPTGAKTPAQTGGAQGEFGGTPTKVPAPKPKPAERVTYQSLARASGIENPDKIRPGQEIKLPGGGTYKVQSGDTLSGIAQNVRLGKIGAATTTARAGDTPQQSGGAGGVAKPKAAGTGMKSTTTPGSKVKTPGPSVTQNPAYNQTGMDDSDMKKPQPKTPGPAVTQNPAYNQTGMDDIDMKKPKPKKMPRAFGLDFMPRVDDPKGGETVKTPFGFSYKTLPQKDDLSDRS